MLKKFIHGLIFGAGFGIAFVAIWIIGIWYLLPSIMETKFKEPEFKNPKVAEILPPGESTTANTTREYSFFKHSGSRMKIPDGGGILALAKLPTNATASRQRTFQLWLTATTLWQIRTTETVPRIEKLPYPESDPVEFLDNYVRDKVGPGAGQGTMTVSPYEIENLKNNVDSGRDDHMNGEFKITTEGVVFFLPDPKGWRLLSW
jgi:hypothetical protein